MENISEIGLGVYLFVCAIILFVEGRIKRDYVIAFEGFPIAINSIIIVARGFELIEGTAFLLWLTRCFWATLATLAVVHAVNGRMNDVIDNILLGVQRWISRKL